MSEGRSGGEPREPSENNYEKALALHLADLGHHHHEIALILCTECVRQALDDLGLKLAPKVNQ